MTVALQIRDVPDHVRAALTRAARDRGQSVQAYLLDLVEREARVLDNSLAFERTCALRIPLDQENDAVQLIREGREQGFEADRAAVR